MSPNGGDLLGSAVRVRLIGNGLGELDRFLGVLIEEVAYRLGSAGYDPAAFARLRNTANKLRLVRTMMNVESPDHLHLQAIGRLRACLRHCGGEIRQPGHSEALGRAGGLIVDGATGGGQRGRLVLTAGALGRISQFYRRMGDDLVAELAKRAPPLDFPRM